MVSKEKIMRSYVHFQIFYLMIKGNRAMLNENERNITLGLIRELQIEHCLLTQNLTLNLTLNFNVFFTKSLLLSWEIPVNYVSLPRLYEKIVDQTYFNVRTLVIFKVKNLDIAEEFFISLKKAKKLQFVRKYLWLIFVDSSPSLKESKLLVPYDCQFIIAYPDNGPNYKLSEFYKLKEKNVIYDYGTWNLEKGLKVTDENFYQRRSDVNGTEFLFESNVKDIFVCENPRICANNEILVGILKMANFKLVPKTKPEIKGLYNLNEGDAINKMSNFHSDFFMYNYLAPLFSIQVNWYVADENESKHADYYIKVFHNDLWMAIGATIFIGSITFLILRFVKKHILKETLFTNIVDDILIVLDYFCDQEDAIGYKNLSFGIASISYRFAAMIIVSALSATITAFLSVSVSEVPFDDLEGFVENGEYRLGAMPTRYPYRYFKASTKPLEQRVFKEFLVPIDLPVALKRLCTDRFAFVFPNNDIYKYKPPCKIFQIENPITQSITAITLAVDTPFRGLFRHNLVYLYSSGIRGKIQKRLVGKPATEEIADFLPVEWDQMVQVVSMVPLGVALAVGLFLMEKFIQFIKNFMDRKSKKWKEKEDENVFSKSNKLIMSMNTQAPPTPPAKICNDVSLYENFLLQKRKKSYSVVIADKMFFM